MHCIVVYCIVLYCIVLQCIVSFQSFDASAPTHPVFTRLCISSGVKPSSVKISIECCPMCNVDDDDAVGYAPGVRESFGAGAGNGY